MIIEVGNIIKSHLSDFVIGGEGSNQFIDKLAGVVKIITKSDQDKDNRIIKKSFPVASDVNVSDCITTGTYTDLIPNSKYGCIVYLEDISNQFLSRTGVKHNWVAKFRLVGWVNKKKLGDLSNNVTSRIITTIISSFPDKPTNYVDYNIQNATVTVVGQEPKNLNPFAKYSYNEETTQYLMHPFDYFSLIVDVNYSIDLRCIEPFTINEQIDC